MPIVASAKKKLRQDEKRFATNQLAKHAYKKAVREYKNTPSREKIKRVFSTIDIAAKKRLIHKNKAARLKTRLTKLLKK